VKRSHQIFLALALLLPISLLALQTAACLRDTAFFTAMSGHVGTTVKSLTSFSTIPVNEFAQCDGLPHPENGHPMPCGSPNRSLPDPNSGDDWRLAQQQREQQQQEREQQEQNRIHRCELQAQHDYEECTRRNPNGYCPMKQCY